MNTASVMVQNVETWADHVVIPVHLKPEAEDESYSYKASENPVPAAPMTSIQPFYEVSARDGLLNPNFVFPDPGKPVMRKWTLIMSDPWWKFDNPIDNTLVRMTSGVVFVSAIMLYVFGLRLCTDCREGSPWLCSLCPRHVDGPSSTSYAFYLQLAIWYDFFIRCLFGMTPLSPFALIANTILKLLDVPVDMVPSPAKRFSFLLGILLNTVLFILHFVVNTPIQAGPMFALIIFSALESIGGFCVGCWFFQAFLKSRDQWVLRNDYRRHALKENNPARPLFEEHRTIDSPIWPLQLYDNTTTIDHGFMYDLVVIGGGSGGLAASKEAARLGQKVAVLDYVKPTPMGSTWGLGGTCVNVGCIPKKLYHTAANYGHFVHEADSYGWSNTCGTNHTHDWSKLRSNIQHHIHELNGGYITGLRSAKVEYINARGSFIDQHTIKCIQPSKGGESQGKEVTITARRILIAVGGRPQYPKIPGAKEHCITSDDIFSLEKAPGKTLVVGASYIALECGGFLSGLGYDVTVMVRSEILRGFDRDCAERIGKNLEDHGVKFLHKCVPVSVELTPTGSRKVVYENAETKQQSFDIYDTVLFAIGRVPLTDELNLPAAGVKVADDRKIWIWNERTTAPNIYALGDVTHKTPELTPVAIKQGLLLAKRIYDKSKAIVNMHHVPTTVFTPLEYGSIGFSEEKAIEMFGSDHIEVYHSEFTPLEYTLPHRNDGCYAKIIVNYLDKERIIGFHYLGPNAGEVTQGFALGFQAGLTYPEWNLTVGIHPTAAEEMVSLRLSKRSGLNAKKTGC